MIDQLLDGLYNSIIQFVRDIFGTVFGDWNYGILFGWLPSDIGVAATSFILFLFGLVLIKLIKDLLPL